MPRQNVFDLLTNRMNRYLDQQGTMITRVSGERPVNSANFVQLS